MVGWGNGGAQVRENNHRNNAGRRYRGGYEHGYWDHGGNRDNGGNRNGDGDRNSIGDQPFFLWVDGEQDSEDDSPGQDNQEEGQKNSQEGAPHGMIFGERGFSSVSCEVVRTFGLADIWQLRVHLSRSRCQNHSSPCVP